MRRLRLRSDFNGMISSLAVLLWVIAPFYRHRVVVHRPPFEIHYALHDIIAYTSDYVVLLLLMVGWAALIHGKPSREDLYLGPWFVVIPLYGLIVLAALSTVWAVDPTYAGYQALRLFLWSALYLVLANLPIPWTWLSGGVVLGILWQAAVALGQGLFGRSLGLYGLGEVRLDPSWSGVSVVITESGRHLRAYGMTQHPNLLGGLTVVYLLLLVGYILTRRQHPSKLRLGVVYVASALGTMALLMTFSRGAWLAALTGVVTVIALLARSSTFSRVEMLRRLLPMSLVVVLLGSAFAATQWELLRPRLGLTYQGAEVRSVDERATLVAGARALREIRPWLGVGVGGFSTALLRLAPQAIADYPIYQPVHRVPLLIAAELGPLGPLLWMSLMVAPLAALIVRPVGRPISGPLAALTAVLVALFTVGWVEAYPWSSQQGMLITWMTLGWWVREYRGLTQT